MPRVSTKPLLVPTQVVQARAAEDAKGKVELKGRGKYKAFHVNGHRKAGVETFLTRKVLGPLPNGAKSVPLCGTAPLGEPFAFENVTETETRKMTKHQKGLRGFKKGKHIHKQIVAIVRDGMPSLLEARLGAKTTGAKGRRGKPKTRAVHPQLRAACRMLARCGFVPIDGDVGVHVGNFATQLDLVCYTKDKPQNEVTIFEIKTGYTNKRDYVRPKYSVSMLPAPAKDTVFSASERDKHMLQLMASTVQAAETYKGKWIIKDSMLLNCRPDRAELHRVPDPILKLNKHILLKLRS